MECQKYKLEIDVTEALYRTDTVIIELSAKEIADIATWCSEEGADFDEAVQDAVEEKYWNGEYNYNDPLYEEHVHDAERTYVDIVSVEPLKEG